MNFRVWYSTESLADFIIENTSLQNHHPVKKKLFESDAKSSKDFHKLPDHIKKIVYLDAPDLIVELNAEPIFTIEVSSEAGTGHNAFQRFARLAASVENDVPAFYVYPDAVIVKRTNTNEKWDKINPLIFKALDYMMTIYRIPAFLFYFASDFSVQKDAKLSKFKQSKGLVYEKNIKYAGCPDLNNSETASLMKIIDILIERVCALGVINARVKLLSLREFMDRRSFMISEFTAKQGNMDLSPLSATKKIPTQYLLNYLNKYENGTYKIGELLRSRNETVVYQVDAAFRGDPYPGCLAAIDYLVCREGKSFEERKYNLVLLWGKLLVDENNKTICIGDGKSSINDFIKDVRASSSKNLLDKSFDELSNYEIPRYYMQVRYGSMYSKVKHIRVYSYFSDCILFPDGALWRDA